MNDLNWKKFTKIGLLIGLGCFLASRLLFGTLNFYIHPRFNGLTMATAVLLILLALTLWWQNSRQHGAHDHDEHHHHEHDHDHDHDIPWSGLLILSIPILLGFFVQPQPLGANALDNREVYFTLSASQSNSLRDATIPVAGERNILDWLYDFQRHQDPTLFNNSEVDVIGFVYRDERFGEEMFMVSRFTINCCVADANPVGLIVHWPDALTLADDTWVQVNGRLQTQSFDNTIMPIVIADSVELTDAPAQPYLYE